ncbi:MAG TPA: ABC transporter permease [Candidatus Cybelea sp.]|nr:ABC transporter permease [Candidatus Cybelea sp.]
MTSLAPSLPPITRHNPSFSPRRVGAMVLRHWYVLRGSWPRIVELAYWPTVQMVLWGFMTQFLVSQTSYVAQAFGVLLSGVLLWDVLFRGQLGVSISFFEEIWARNLGHLFVSPLRPYEMVGSLGGMSLIRTVIGVVPAAIMATIFFGFSLASLGISLVAFFFLLLVMGWALGLLICGIVMRYGQGAESLAWAAIFAVAPVSGIYYPISVLPGWLQVVAHFLPSSYVFEGMRGVLARHEVRVDLMAHAAVLDVVYLAVGIAAFLAYFRMARRRGLLLQQGE